LPIVSDNWYTLDESAKILKVSKETVARYLRAKRGKRRLSGEKRGPKAQWYVRGRELRRFLREVFHYRDEGQV
jgi:predicted transcriptional regulator